MTHKENNYMHIPLTEKQFLLEDFLKHGQGL